MGVEAAQDRDRAVDRLHCAAPVDRLLHDLTFFHSLSVPDIAHDP